MNRIRVKATNGDRYAALLREAGYAALWLGPGTASTSLNGGCTDPTCCRQHTSRFAPQEWGVIKTNANSRRARKIFAEHNRNNSSTEALKLTHVAIYDPDQLVIWGYGETHDAALADARQEFLDSGYEGDPEDECKSVSCSEALAKTKRGGEFDFVIVPVDGEGELIGAVAPDEAERFKRFEAP